MLNEVKLRHSPLAKNTMNTLRLLKAQLLLRNLLLVKPFLFSLLDLLVLDSLHILHTLKYLLDVSLNMWKIKILCMTDCLY